jgi:hypothetical protein
MVIMLHAGQRTWTTEAPPDPLAMPAFSVAPNGETGAET